MNLALAIAIYGGGPGSGCRGPSCGRPAGSGKSGKETKEEAIQRILRERNLGPQWKHLAESVYQEERFGGLKNVQSLARRSQEPWQESDQYYLAGAKAVQYTKRLGRSKGVVVIQVAESKGFGGEKEKRPTVEVTVRHKMKPESTTWTTPERRTFVWEPRWAQLRLYLARQYGLKDTAKIEKLKGAD